MWRFWFLGLTVIALGINQDAAAEKPTIMPQKDELVIQEGSELKIECYSKGSSVQFSFPNETFMSPRSPYKIATSNNGTSTFLRKNAISLDTGWYACAAKGIEIENHFKILNHTQKDVAWIYIYVNSQEPFADRYSTFAKPIIVLVESPAIIPCRPTSPRWEVELWQNSRIVQRSDKVRFDPKIGFTIDQLVFETLVIRFQCRINDVIDRYDLYYSRAKGRKPKINSNDKELLLQEGDQLKIECYGETEKQFLFPTREGLTSKYVIIHENNGKNTFFRRETVNDDTGWYGCAEKGINMNIIPGKYMEYTRTEIDWIYVFVYSNFILSVSNNFFPEYSDESDVHIIYLPTSLSSNVTLKLENTMTEQDNRVRFDPKFGFLVKNGLEDSADYYELKTGISFSSTIDYIYKLSREDVKLLTSPIRTLYFTGEDLHLPCLQLSDTNKHIKWYIHSKASENHINYTESKYSIDGSSDSCWIVNILSITNVTESDSGEYTCSNLYSPDIKSFLITVIDQKSRDYMKFNLQEGEYEFVRWQNESIKWIVDFHVFLGAQISWISPSNQSIDHAVTFELSRQKFHLTDGFRDLIEIHNLTHNDSGVYRMEIDTPVGIIKVNFTIDVQGPPIVHIENGTRPYYATHDEIFLVRCCITGSPEPNITWTFSKHSYFQDNNDYISTVNTSNYKLVFAEEIIMCFDLKMTINTSGILTCTACNFIKCNAATMEILFSESVKRFGIISPAEQCFLGDFVTLTCVGSVHDFHTVSWDENFYECYNTAHQKMVSTEKNDTRFTKNVILHLENVTECHQRSYSCSGRTINGNVEKLSYDLNLSLPQAPYFKTTNLKELKITWNPASDHNKSHTLICCADGNPRPNVTWFKDDLPLEENQEHHFLPEKCELLILLNLRDGNGGRYKCIAQNRFGQIEDYTDFQIEGNDQRQTDKSLLLLNIIFAFLLIGLIVAWIILRKRRIKRSRQKFKEAILARFNEGALNYVQPYIRIADQAEVLPYDVKWEYPRKLLKFDKILGSGAFGIVRKAEAKSICPGRAVTTVAVKMVRATHRLHYMTALTRELKVLVHLGGHLNIVNLLGACTQNVSYGELLVIVEFCRFGNLHDYLLRGRANFIDQLDPETEEIIGPNLGMDRITVEHNSEHVSDCEDSSDTGNSCCSTDSVGKNTNTNDEALRNGTVQPGLRCHYRSDDPEMIVESICTKDLLCWAWQVTRGMRYLGVRKVVHGDLAARNILLADNNVIKICDFGLAEILYKDDDYKKMGDDPLPLQWMAVESINDRVFSIQSDIWSFGILLWEFFTLAETPYRGTNPRNLYQKLSTGYRLSQPKYAPKNIYRMMMKCWEANPVERPPFLKLQTDIALLLDDGIRTYYMDMDPPYTELTKETVETGKIDFLTMDPSEITAVSFSSDQDKVKLCNVPLDRSSCPPYPGPSSQDICRVSVSTEN